MVWWYSGIVLGSSSSLGSVFERSFFTVQLCWGDFNLGQRRIKVFCITLPRKLRSFLSTTALNWSHQRQRCRHGAAAAFASEEDFPFSPYYCCYGAHWQKVLYFVRKSLPNWECLETYSVRRQFTKVCGRWFTTIQCSPILKFNQISKFWLL